ncbi:MAG: DNA mismatch repair protein MutS [candidate division Zixibacteria bacterium]|nr:DNA mismatch repair protein MutS [candidate division Zixibacteria bacterium]
MSKKSDQTSNITPLMRQYHAIKEQHPDKILFFRMGDFYEMFGDDAVRAAPMLGIALTSRSHGNSEKVPLAGVPYHAADRYLAKLVAKGEKVVIVEQVEDPKLAKGLVKREIVEILTPGTATIDIPDEERRASILAAVVVKNNKTMGLAVLDLSTGAFMVDEGDIEDIIERLRLAEPSEVIYPAGDSENNIPDLLGLSDRECRLTGFEEWHFDLKTAQRELNRHFGTVTLDGFGLADARLAITAAGAVFRYLNENHREHLSHINRLNKFDDAGFMTLDYNTVRNLELVKSIANATEENSLFSVINFCRTPAGSRRLKNSLLRPFKTRDKIELRLSGVAELVKNRELCYQFREETKNLPDLERFAGRLGIGKLNPRQMAGIKDALIIGNRIKELLKPVYSPLLLQIARSLPDNKELIEKIDSALTDEPPLTSNKGDIFKRGYASNLDGLNDSIKDARLYIGSLQKSERERTGINTLKVGFNKVFGYYIEITRANAKLVPEEYIRKQTLVNAERYITPELKEKEELILAAEEKIFRLEQELYEELVEYLNGHIGQLIQTADLLAEIDLISGLAELAVQHGYSRPEFFEDTRLNIVGGRHPVIEDVLPAGSFVANDVVLSVEDQRIIILTGPNMSGKSTYLRQIGLIVILAQAGSFVPADRAEIGLVDRVFTRVGALDNIARGQSTFLVEMVETANILNNATERSLVLLDEVGRGTSTFDGLSVAWSVVEYINENLKARTVFATHYHELTSMASIYERVHNFQVAVKKWEDRVIFLHKIIAGGCDDSYGIEVARLAGLPRSTLGRAKQILKLLESGKFTQGELGKGIYKEKVQPTLFDPQSSKVEDAIKELDLDNLTPVQAFELLRRFKKDID